MAEYDAKSTSHLSFEVSEVTQNQHLVGTLSYKGWFRSGAVIEMPDHFLYQVEANGFWGTVMEMKDGDKVLARFEMNWRGNMMLQTYFAGIEKDYIFRQRGIFKGTFILEDEDKSELVVMKPNMKWRSMNYEYRMTTSENFEAFADKSRLLMICLHCANYYMSMTASVGTGV